MSKAAAFGVRGAEEGAENAGTLGSLSARSFIIDENTDIHIWTWTVEVSLSYPCVGEAGYRDNWLFITPGSDLQEDSVRDADYTSMRNARRKRSRGRDDHCWLPPAQIRTSAH